MHSFTVNLTREEIMMSESKLSTVTAAYYIILCMH